LPDVYQLFDVELRVGGLRTDQEQALHARSAWLLWSVLNYQQLAKLDQPPYGDRAILLKSTGRIIGSCGLVPSLAPFEQLPGFAKKHHSRKPGRYSPEFGLFYAISPAHQRRGYATEAARALVDYAFQHLHLKRIVATTSYDNAGSMAVMRRLGMSIEKNPLPEPVWFQVVGVLENTKTFLKPAMYVVLRQEKSQNDSRFLSASLTADGDLKIEGQDIGDSVREIFASAEYEWAWTVRASALPALKQALGNPNDLLKALEKEFSAQNAARLLSFLEDHEIPYETWSRTGD